MKKFMVDGCDGSIPCNTSYIMSYYEGACWNECDRYAVINQNSRGLFPVLIIKETIDEFESLLGLGKYWRESDISSVPTLHIVDREHIAFLPYITKSGVMHETI